MKTLKLQDFVNDYNRLVVQGANNDPVFVKALINEHYAHISEECWNWLRNRKPLEVGKWAWEIKWYGQHPRDVLLKVDSLEGTCVEVNGLWDDCRNWIAV